MAKSKPERTPRGVRTKLQLQIEFLLPERTNMSSVGTVGRGRVGERTEHWFLDVEPRDAAVVLKAFRKIVAELARESAPGGRLRASRKG